MLLLALLATFCHFGQVETLGPGPKPSGSYAACRAPGSGVPFIVSASSLPGGPLHAQVVVFARPRPVALVIDGASLRFGPSSRFARTGGWSAYPPPARP